MASPFPGWHERPVRPAGLAAAAIAGCVLVGLRSFVFVFFEGANFDSDQAVFGLMAKHLAELRAFPLFMYAQSYILAVPAWLAAPVVAVLGPTVPALKLPILGINLACAALLISSLVRDAGLRARVALVAALPFLLPPVITTALLTQPVGGNVEPFLYVLLLWRLRRRGLPFGLVAGIGFLHREFTAYGVVALLVLSVSRGRTWDRRHLAFGLRAAVGFLTVLAVVELLRPLSTYPGTRGAGIGWRGLESTLARLETLVTRTLPMLFGLVHLPVAGMNVRSRVVEGLLGPVLAPLLASAAVVLGVRLLRTPPERRADERLDFPLYLGLVGAQALVAYVVLGRGAGSDQYLRYILLALLLPVAGFALVALVEPSTAARRAALAATVAWAAVNGVEHAALASEYLGQRPPSPYRLLADDLRARGIRHGAADYWTAYHVSYLAGEEVKLHARGFGRISEYRALFFENLESAVDVRTSGPCPDGRVVAGFCVVGPPAPRRRLKPEGELPLP
jgi:hypothetical protein